MKLSPTDEQSLWNLTLAYSTTRDFRRALATVRQLLERSQEYASCHFILGWCLSGLEQNEEAIEEYRKALRLRPDFFEAAENLGALYSSLGRRQDAIEAYNLALEIRPFMARTHEELSYVYLQVGRIDDAEREHGLAAHLASDSDAKRLMAQSAKRRFLLESERAQG